MADTIEIGSRCVFTLASNLIPIGHKNGEECTVCSLGLSAPRMKTYWVLFDDGTSHPVADFELRVSA